MEKYIYAVCHRGTVKQFSQTIRDARRLNIQDALHLNANINGTFMCTYMQKVCQSGNLEQFEQALQEVQDSSDMDMDLNINMKYLAMNSIRNKEIFKHIVDGLSYTDKIEVLAKAIKDGCAGSVNYLFSQDSTLFVEFKIDFLDRLRSSRDVQDVLTYHIISHKGVQSEIDTLMTWYSSSGLIEAGIKIRQSDLKDIKSMYTICSILSDYIRHIDNRITATKSTAMCARAFILQLIRGISAIEAGVTHENIETFFLLKTITSDSIRDKVQHIAGLPEHEQPVACDKLLIEMKTWQFFVYYELMVVQFQLHDYEKCKEYAERILLSLPCEHSQIKYRSAILDNCSKILLAYPNQTPEYIELATRCYELT